MMIGDAPGGDPLVAATRAHELVEVLTARGETVATAESLTAEPRSRVFRLLTRPGSPAAL